MEKEILKIRDGEPVSDEIVNHFNLRPFCSLNDEGIFISKFVGLVISKSKILVSYPKHLDVRGEEDISLILGSIVKTTKSFGTMWNENIECNIPYGAYLFVLDYYYKFGIFHEIYNIKKEGYSGKVDWTATFRKNHSVVSEDNIVFLPFEIKRSMLKDSFIGKCMKYVISDGFMQFGKYIGVGEVLENSNLEYSPEDTISLLKEEKNNHFKDLDIQLIDSLIDYLEWRGMFIENNFFLTKSFDRVWESMVNEYLSKNYRDYDESKDTIVFADGCKKHHFSKKTDYIQSALMTSQNGVSYSVEYDHFDRNADTILVFDSKYYVEVNDVNYKQMVYHYMLMNSKANQDVKRIINGLLIPNEGEYYSKVHVDRRDIDGVFIIEHYLNMRRIMENYVKTRSL